MYLTREPINACDVIAPQGLSRSSERNIMDGIASPSESSLRPSRNDGPDFRSGASVLFLGIIRDHSNGKRVLYLEYEAYEEMAERMLSELVDTAFQKWPLEEIRLIHRLGQVELGEIAVAVEVRSVHRDDAYQASRFLIEGIKHDVPIWKKEYFEDGTNEWAFCQPVIATEIC